MKISTKEKPSEKKLKASTELWELISKLYHSKTKDFNQFLKQWDISLPQYYIMKQIARNQRISQKELAEKLLVSKGNITQLISKLEKSGYIVREQQWKTKYLSLAEKGLSLYQQIDPKQELFLFDQFQGISKKEQKQMIGLLEQLLNNQTNEEEEKHKIENQ